MPEKNPSAVHGKPPPMIEAEPISLAKRAGLFALVLVCALAIFVFGPNYTAVFPTNGSLAYAAVLTTVFLAAALLLRRSPKLSQYWRLAYAFFAASAVNLVSDLLINNNTTIIRSLGFDPKSNAGLGIGKVYDTLLVVITILVLVKLSGADLGSLYIKKGNLKWGLGIGVLLLFNFLTSVLIFFGTGYQPAALGSAVGWGFVFALSNGFLEELWVRGLFFKQLLPLLGNKTTVVVTAAWFAALHMLAVAYLPAILIPIFLVNTFTLGLACGILMLKTNSIWGAVLVHAAADLFLFVATLAFH